MKKETISSKNHRKKAFLSGSSSRIAHSWLEPWLISPRDLLLQKVIHQYHLYIQLGVDVASANSKIDWETFLQIYCIFETGNIDKESLVEFWIKFFDPKLIGHVNEKEYMILLEELIRGNSLAYASETT
jgi:hypothetical protein